MLESSTDSIKMFERPSEQTPSYSPKRGILMNDTLQTYLNTPMYQNTPIKPSP